MSYRSGTLNKGYTGVKCWQMCERTNACTTIRFLVWDEGSLDAMEQDFMLLKKAGLNTDYMGWLTKLFLVCYWASVEALYRLTALRF